MAGVALYGIAVMVSRRYQMSDQTRMLLFLAAYLLLGSLAFVRYRDNLLKHRFFDENLLIILATLGAFGIRRYIEADAVMLLFEIGGIFEAASLDRTKRMIAQMIDIRPEYAVRITPEKEESVEPQALKIGDRIIIRPGERVPVDAVIEKGMTNLDTKALTGEAMPIEAAPGDSIYSGSINLTGVIEASVMAAYEDSTVSRIMEMVEKAQENRAESESLVTTFTRFYSPIIALFGLLVMILPPLTFDPGARDIWIFRGLVMLIAACPAGLVMSTPVAFLGGIASAARQGIVIKGGNYLEDLTKVDTFIFDKTGTLTEGEFKIQEIYAEGMSEEELLRIVAHVESYSNHPIAQSLRAAYTIKFGKPLAAGDAPAVLNEEQGEGVEQPLIVERILEEGGYGVSAICNGKKVHVGNSRLARRNGADVPSVKTLGTALYVVIEGHYVGHIVMEDAIRQGGKETLRELAARYQAVLIMLTGDAKSTASRVAKALHMDYYYADLLPQDKLELVEEFLTAQNSTEKVACVGDGINDAPILARADIGIAMGALGAAAAIEAADIVLMDDELPRILDVMKVANETMRVVNWNIKFAMLIKLIVLSMAFIGYITMWQAVAADLGVMIISIINAGWVVRYRAS